MALGAIDSSRRCAMLSSLADTMYLQFRGFFVRHVEPDMIAEISPEMLAQLRETALRGVLVLPLVALGSITAVNWLYGVYGINPVEGHYVIVAWVVVLSCA